LNLEQISARISEIENLEEEAQLEALQQVIAELEKLVS
jgi:hypothetical protein